MEDGRLEKNLASPPSTMIKLNGLKSVRSAPAGSAYCPSPDNRSLKRSPRDGRPVSGAPNPLRLVTTPSRPRSDTPSHVPPDCRSLPARRPPGVSHRASDCAGRACSSSRLPAMTSCQRGWERHAKAKTHTVNLRSATRHAACGMVYRTIVSCISLRADRAESSLTPLLVREASGCVCSVAEWLVARLPAPAKRHPIANLVG